MTARPKDFVVRSDLRGLLAVTRDWAVVLGLATLGATVDQLWLTLVLIVLIGRWQFAIGEALIHEASHHNLFATRSWNDRLQFLYAWPFFVHLAAWRRQHLAHHALLGTEGDHIWEDYQELGLTESDPDLVWVLFGRPLCGLVALDYVRSLFAINGLRDWLRVGAFWAVVTAFSAVTGLLDEVLLYWVVPQLLVFSTTLYHSEIVDHFRTFDGNRTRTGWLSNLIGHNNGFHAVHHTWASIPFHQLPAAHAALLGPDAPNTVGGPLELWRDLHGSGRRPPAKWSAFWPVDER